MDSTEVTSLNLSESGIKPTVPRSDPQLQWTDAVGSHSYLLAGRYVMGSAEGADIVVAADDVSRLHASIEIEADGAWIRDLGSKNGTFVNGIRVTAARVPDGGTIHLGTAPLTLVYDQNESEVELWPDEHFGPLVGRSTIMRALFARIHRVAQLDSTVLIQGETGTGKELVARAIHQTSPRRDKPFVVVDCGALAETLLEAELFGHTKGAFTGAAAARAGAIEMAVGGTVFLDEIGEMPLSMQPKLLRALEGRMVRRIGETGYREVDVRFLAATHRDLPSLVNSGNFREDLYFRLNVVPISLPALRARPEDVPLLVARLVPPSARGAITPELMRELSGRAWAGNVRELRNFVERTIALGAREAIAMGKAADRASATRAGQQAESFPAVSMEEAFKVIRDRWLDHLEREYMKGMIARFNRDTGAIAQAAGLDRSYVYRLIRKHEL